MIGNTRTQPSNAKAVERGRIITDERVVFVVPPYQSTLFPSPGSSKLLAILRGAAVPSQIVYSNFRFAETIGLLLYEFLGRLEGPLSGAATGEFVFSQILFGHSDERVAEYVERFGPPTPLLGLEKENFRRLIKSWVSKARVFLAEEAERVLAEDPTIVGIPSNFFDNCAALALFGALKSRRPELVTVMGGFNCAGVMGETLIRHFPQVDYVFQGEADFAILDFVAAREGEREAIPGVLSRARPTKGGLCRTPSGPDLDRFPIPDYSDYFETLEASPLRGRFEPSMPFELSRGCWWGQQQHCPFCAGFTSKESLAFRSKSGDRALDELEHLVRHYGLRRIDLVDSIPDPKHFDTIFRALAKTPLADQMFLECMNKLDKSKVKMLSDANIRKIQPGFESLSDESLKLLKKGTTSIQNVEMIKWLSEYGVEVNWIYIHPVPGDPQDEGEMAALGELIESIHHLQPPFVDTAVILQRYAPYFRDPELAPIEPMEIYRFVYPLGEEAVARIGYTFTSDKLDALAKTDADRRLKEALERWRKAYATSNLFMLPTRRALLVYDTRPCAQRRWWRLSGLERLVYEYCDARHGLRAICDRFAEEATADEIKVLLRSLVDRRLMHTSRERYLSLALPYTERSRLKHSTADVWSLISANSTARMIAWLPLRSCKELIGALGVSWPRSWALALAVMLFLNVHGKVRAALSRLAVARSQLPTKLRWYWIRWREGRAAPRAASG